MSDETRLWRKGGFAVDEWRMLQADEPVMAQDKIILPAARLDEMVAEARLMPMGALLSAGEPIDLLLPHLAGLELVALDFPSFTDGRSFSKAEILRSRHGFAGEIRAVGDVLIDQIPLMLRCGFDSFLVRNKPTIAALERGPLPGVDLFYQPGQGAETAAGGRSWARRPAIREASTL
ncbi:uncharacterized protein (DUF934 family) [Rhodopseudomonas julia]|uniref:Uncharacterized protein (DUF934 family) n=1 Tax=Rhodopseudomonas julia TaxID=200617 RepID=A0ABU0C6C9_9BRAD|nr:DUF934 domain-containing protein [Rhodopseudomonas julia]MDQ0325509.1 uncharacterized protein (DUF934 family) [Rhodopseudomonas julia]